MSARTLSGREGGGRFPAGLGSSGMVRAEERSSAGGEPQGSFVDLGESRRMALMITPRGRGAFREQVEEVLSELARRLEKQSESMTVTLQTVFLREAGNQAECERMLSAFYGAKRPVTNYVLQAPCCGAALALEAWAIGGGSVRVEHHGSEVLAVSYDSVRWIYCAGIGSGLGTTGLYRQALESLERMKEALVRAGSGFEHVVRTWFYVGGITEPEAGMQRYQELNRARADFYRGINFCGALLDPASPRGVYPASTGIGMSGAGMLASCMALETERDDVSLFPLENPRQTPAYVYHSRYSPRSPKFSRAMALVLGDYVTTWISGTASVLDSESRHAGDVESQTEETINNIERLIAEDNFRRHGVKGAGAKLDDLAKIRVYLKRPEEFEKCRAICQRRFGSVPAIYAVADVCRPELLVEIEGVAFSRCSPTTSR